MNDEQPIKTRWQRRSIGVATVLLVSSSFIVPRSSFSQGPLAPSGLPAPTLKTLDQIEPRIPISSVPTTIVQRGSYYLTRNLSGDSTTNGITIADSYVFLDLNGFELSAVALGSGAAIQVAPGLRHVTIAHGTVRNWGFGNGVDARAASGVVLEDLHATNCGDAGLRAGSNSMIRGCTAHMNGNFGIVAGPGSVVRECTVSDNDLVSPDSGIKAGHGALVIQCTAWGNGAGIQVDAGGQVRECSVHRNDTGILGGPGSLIAGCTVVSNSGDGIRVEIGGRVEQCQVRANGLDGITLPNDGAAVGNHCTENGRFVLNGAGIHTTLPGNRVEDNHCILNDFGIRVDGASSVIARNMCRFNATNYVLAAGNVVGPVTNVMVNHPWANFEF